MLQKLLALAVHPDYQSNGRGSKMLSHLEKKSIEADVSPYYLYLPPKPLIGSENMAYKSTKIDCFANEKASFI